MRSECAIFPKTRPVRAGNPFHGAQGAVGVPPDIPAGLPCGSTYCVATCPLAASSSSTCGLATKPALAVGNRHRMDIARFHSSQPGGADRRHPGVYHAGNMAAQGIECQGWGVLRRRGNFSVRNQPQFDQRLEPVANPQMRPSRCSKSAETASAIRGLRNVVAIKLAGAVRFVAAEKPPGNIKI